MIDLDAIEARATAATNGPWRAGSVAAEGKVWCPCDPSPVLGAGERCLVSLSLAYPHTADREFIAHAREDVPALVAEIRRLRTELTRACK